MENRNRHFDRLSVTGRAALGIEADSPQRSEDLQRKARPEGERPKEVKNVKLKVKSKQDGKIASCLAMTGLANR